MLLLFMICVVHFSLSATPRSCYLKFIKKLFIVFYPVSSLCLLYEVMSKMVHFFIEELEALW